VAGPSPRALLPQGSSSARCSWPCSPRRPARCPWVCSHAPAAHLLRWQPPVQSVGMVVTIRAVAVEVAGLQAAGAEDACGTPYFLPLFPSSSSFTQFQVPSPTHHGSRAVLSHPTHHIFPSPLWYLLTSELPQQGGGKDFTRQAPPPVQLLPHGHPTGKNTGCLPPWCHCATHSALLLFLQAPR